MNAVEQRVTLRPMTDVETKAYIAQAMAGYADQLSEFGGRDRADARAKAETDLGRLFPDGQLTEGHRLRVAEVDGKAVGRLWIAPDSPSWPVGTAYIYDIEVDESARGQGFGRDIMVAAEAEAGEMGCTSIALNVFGGNAPAIRLYQSLGFEVTSLQLRKPLA